MSGAYRTSWRVTIVVSGPFGRLTLTFPIPRALKVRPSVAVIVRSIA